MNTYILQLVKENETLQGRLSDMKVTLQENKTLLRDFMDSQKQGGAPSPEAPSEVFGDKTTSVVNDAKRKVEPQSNQDLGEAEQKQVAEDDQRGRECQLEYEQSLKAIEVQIATLYDRISQIAFGLETSLDLTPDDKKEDHVRWMQTKLNVFDPENHINPGVWIDRGAEKASKIYEEFVYKVERENRFLQMLHLGVAEIRKLETQAETESKLNDARKASEHYRTNLVGYMLT